MESFIILFIGLAGFVFYEVFWENIKARRREKKELNAFRKLLNIDTTNYK